MSAGLRDTHVGANTDSVLPRRPSLGMSILLDGALATGTYFATYWLRFSGARLETFLPGAQSSLLFVVTGQLIALALVGAYARRPRIEWLVRVAVGVAGHDGAGPCSAVVASRRRLAQRIHRGRDAAVGRRARLARRLGTEARAKARVDAAARTATWSIRRTRWRPSRRSWAASTATASC